MKKYESYGDSFIKIIKSYTEENNINTNITQKTSSPSKDLKLRYENTYKLYKRDLSLEDIAKEVDFTPSTVVNHLIKCEEEGKEVNWNRFLNNPTKERQISNSIEKLGTEKLKDIKDDLPESISYLDINIFMAKNKIK